MHTFEVGPFACCASLTAGLTALLDTLSCSRISSADSLSRRRSSSSRGTCIMHNIATVCNQQMRTQVSRTVLASPGLQVASQQQGQCTVSVLLVSYSSTLSKLNDTVCLIAHLSASPHSLSSFLHGAHEVLAASCRLSCCHGINHLQETHNTISQAYGTQKPPPQGTPYYSMVFTRASACYKAPKDKHRREQRLMVLLHINSLVTPCQ